MRFLNTIGKLLFGAALFVGSVIGNVHEPVLNDDIIQHVNSQQSSWTAGRNPRFEGVTVGEVRGMLRSDLSRNITMKPIMNSIGVMDVPTSFDSRTQWPGCIHDVRDQMQCGSCWAFSASEVLSDRLCIDSKGQQNVILSPQYLVSCDTSSEGCQGGYLDTTWKFLKKTGIPADSCVPYTSGSGDSGNCPTTCKDGTSPIPTYRATNLGSATDAATIASAIVSGGPVQAAFSVYQDFMHYTSGVYKHVTGSLLGGHAIEIVGFGITTDNVQYWIVKNSWGTGWGQQGYFWILKGQNECGIESQVFWGDALVSEEPEQPWNQTLIGDYPLCDVCVGYYVYSDNPATICAQLHVLADYFCKEASSACNAVIDSACNYIKSGHCDWPCVFKMVCAELHVCPMPSKGCC